MTLRLASGTLARAWSSSARALEPSTSVSACWLKRPKKRSSRGIKAWNHLNIRPLRRHPGPSCPLCIAYKQFGLPGRSNYVVIAQPAVRILRQFDLQRTVFDVELRVKSFGDARCKLIAGMSRGHHQMTGQRGLRGAKRPDVQIVHPADARKPAQENADLAGIDTGGHRAKHHLKRVFLEIPGAKDDHGNHDQCRKRVEPIPMR